jgi:hypothetical protein
MSYYNPDDKSSYPPFSAELEAMIEDGVARRKYCAHHGHQWYRVEEPIPHSAAARVFYKCRNCPQERP